jgi:cAMP-dependent protein kinase regulator
MPSYTPSDIDHVQTNITKEEVDAENAKIKAQQGRSRRPGVAAESIDNDQVQNYKAPVHAKDEETEAKLRKTMQDNKNLQVLFGHLQGQPLTDVINAFYFKEYNSGDDIIRQGDEGDCLYIIDVGKVEIFVRRGESTPGNKGDQVLTLGPGGLFGELALMYAAPRAATVTVSSDTARMFVLDALDFKMLLAQSSQAQYARYEGWLHEVDILQSLNHFELSKLAEALQTEHYKPGDEIIKQGDPGDRFFILEEGSAAAYITGDEGEMHAKAYDKVGDYFGEIALLTSQPRKVR